MDWITVAVNSINGTKIDSLNIDMKSMQIYSYISSIGIIWEAIQQLHRVIVDDKSIPFKKDSSIFKERIFKKDDNDYFKEIRAIFGAHPVNIKYNEESRLFASWPYPSHLDEYDIQVSLYSNEVGKDDIVFGVKFIKLEHFAYKRYLYLNELITVIDRQYDEYVMQKRSELIPKSENIIKQLEVLLCESEARLNNDYYVSAIADLQRLYSAKAFLNNEFCTKYIEKLDGVVEEIYVNLQKMEIVDLQTDVILYPDYPNTLSYEISKLLSFLSHPIQDPLFDFYVKRINEESNQEIIVDNNDSKDLIFLKLKIMMYYKMWI